MYNVYCLFEVKQVTSFGAVYYVTHFTKECSLSTTMSVYELCTALRLDKIRHRSEEIYPKILIILPFKGLFLSILSKFYAKLISI